MSASPPKVSVVIPTRDRCDILRRTLAALARQSMPADGMEVIVAADGCTDDTLALLGEARAPYRLGCVQLPGRGAAAARNAGAKAASGEILLFLDDDIEPAPGLVAAHLRSHEGNADVVAIGPCPPLLHGRQDFWRVLLRRWWFDVFTAMAEPGHRFTYRDVLTGNLSMRRTLFERIGRFDAAFGVDVSHEDWELGIRLLEAGARLTHVAGAMAWHHDRTDLDRSYRRARQDGKGDVLIGRLHPEVRPALPLADAGLAPRPVERAVRFLAFGAPAAGDALGRLSRRALDGLEWLRLRGAWRTLNGTTRRYWYWRGVADELRGRAELSRFRAYHGRGAAGARSEPEIDLAAGLAEAERRLDAERPAAARFRLGNAVIGRVAPVPGAEPLRGAHLRPLLDQRFGLSLLNAAAVEAVSTNRGRRSRPRLAKGPGAEGWGARARVRAPAPMMSLPVNRLDVPHLVAELDLTEGMHDLDAPLGYGAARVLVRARRRLIGWVCISPLSPPRLSASALRTAIAEQLGPALRPSLLGGAGDAGRVTRKHVRHCPPVTVVVCTRDRTDRLARCLKALLELDYPAYEVVVIDNGPSDDRTVRLAAELGVRYVHEEVPGLDRARNCGIRAARHEIIAFTDDDVRADRGWLREIAAAFADPEIMAVTGFVAPETLDTAAERLFELEYGGMSHGVRPRTFRRCELRNTQLLWASAIGCGANMAFRRRVLDAVGGFDVGLDVGTLAGGAGDVEMLHRVVVSGHTAAYRPSALVWHSHRRTLPELRRQLFDNGRSFGAYLVTCFRRRSVPRHAILRFAVQDWFVRWILRRLVWPGSFPRSLIIAEMTGAVLSPLFYLGAQWQKRRRPDPPAPAQPDSHGQARPDAPAAHAVDEGGDALEPAMTANA